MKSVLKTFPALLCAAVLSACGSLVDMGRDSDDENDQRRVYVNDPANNDSLPAALLGAGVYFVMQPGKRYLLQVPGAAANDQLQLYSASGNQYFFQRIVGGSLRNNVQTFALRDSLATSANYFLINLRSAGGSLGTLPAEVRLVPADSAMPSTVKVRLVMVRTLTGLSTTDQKDAFAARFLALLDSIYAVQGIDLETSYEIVEPGLAPMAADFRGTTIFPGGTRIANTVYLYLVDHITINGKPSPDGNIILGFAPREAFDLASSEVVLSVEKNALPDPIAVTAAHEMGHFLGLRHTTSTALDKEGDDDLSNATDGFPSTPSCGWLVKRMAPAPISSIRMPKGRPYCLRVALEDCDDCDDRKNLMFPYQCDRVVQKTLVNEQAIFVRQNLSLFQR